MRRDTHSGVYGLRRAGSGGGGDGLRTSFPFPGLVVRARVPGPIFTTRAHSSAEGEGLGAAQFQGYPTGAWGCSASVRRGSGAAGTELWVLGSADGGGGGGGCSAVPLRVRVHGGAAPADPERALGVYPARFPVFVVPVAAARPSANRKGRTAGFKRCRRWR